MLTRGSKKFKHVDHANKRILSSTSGFYSAHIPGFVTWPNDHDQSILRLVIYIYIYTIHQQLVRTGGVRLIIYVNGKDLVIITDV